MIVPKAALDLIISFEGYIRRLPDDRAAPYICPAGVPTIGYGSIRHYPSRKPVTMRDAPITRATATEYLDAELDEKDRAFRALTSAPYNDLMRGAIVSFIYNCGPGAYRGSTLRTVINNRQWDRVPYELSKWRRGGGRVLAGLVRRRNAEAALFMQGVALLGQRGAEPPKPTAPSKPSSPPGPSLWGRVMQWVLK